MATTTRRPPRTSFESNQRGRQRTHRKFFVWARDSPIGLAKLGPLFERGWTWRDIKDSTRSQINVALAIIHRTEVLKKGGELTPEVLKEHPEFWELKDAYDEEREKLEKLREKHAESG